MKLYFNSENSFANENNCKENKKSRYLLQYRLDYA